MTPTTRILVIANVTVWSAIAVLACVWLLNRIVRYSRSRHPRPTEPPSPAAVAAARSLLLRLVPGTLRDRTPQHEGATESFGDELRALADLPPAPELVSDVETELRWAQIWHDFEHDLQVRVDDVFAPLLSALTEPLDAKTCMRLDAAAQRTGEFERAELDELLAVAG